MNRILYQNRCKCNEERKRNEKFSRTKKRKRRKEGKLYPHPENDEIRSKTFRIRYEKRLSAAEKLILNNFQKKYIYYAIDDILDSLKLNLLERDNILAILYSPILSLQNNFAVNFFDIWIGDIFIEEVSKVNKFLNTEPENLEQFSYITLKLFYLTSVPVKKQEPLW